MKTLPALLLVVLALTLAGGVHAESIRGIGLGDAAGKGERQASKDALERAALNAAYLAVEKTLGIMPTEDEFDEYYREILWRPINDATIAASWREGNLLVCEGRLEYDPDSILRQGIDVGRFESLIRERELNCLVYITETVFDRRQPVPAPDPAAETGVEHVLQKAGCRTFRGQARPSQPAPFSLEQTTWELRVEQDAVAMAESRTWSGGDGLGTEELARLIQSGDYERAYRRLRERGIDVMILGEASAEITDSPLPEYVAAQANVEIHAFLTGNQRSLDSRVVSGGNTALTPLAAAKGALYATGQQAGMEMLARIVQSLRLGAHGPVSLNFRPRNDKEFAAVLRMARGLPGAGRVATQKYRNGEAQLAVYLEGGGAKLAELLDGEPLSGVYGYLRVASQAGGRVDLEIAEF